MTFLSHVCHWLSRNRWHAGGVAVAVAILAAVLVLSYSWWDEITAVFASTNLYLFCVLIGVLPLFGVSITMVYVVVGARFGGPLGLAFIAVATAAHLAGTHLIAHSFLQRPVRQMLERRNYQLPKLAQKEPVALALLGALVPGPPYIVRNYLLALSGVPFRIYFFIAWPIYVVRSGVAIFLGDWFGDLTFSRVAILGGIFALKLSICALVVRHLYRKHHVRRAPSGKPLRQARVT